jgi:hypothetical protein
MQRVEKILPQVFVDRLVAVLKRMRDAAERRQELLLQLLCGCGGRAVCGAWGESSALRGEAGDDSGERSVGLMSGAGVRVCGETKCINKVAFLTQSPHEIEICGETDALLSPGAKEEAALDLQVAVLQIAQSEVALKDRRWSSSEPRGGRGAERGRWGLLALLVGNESLTGR